MPSMTAAFDIAFGPAFSTVTSGGFLVKLEGEGLAKVNGRTVTDYDCYFCGDVGRHTGEFCQHQDAMFEAADELLELREAERMQDYADAQMDERPW